MKNPQAFPRPASTDAIPLDHTQYGNSPQFSDAQDGMTLRDYFAAKALQAMVTRGIENDTITIPDIAEDAYRYADAMLLEREKK